MSKIDDKINSCLNVFAAPSRDISIDSYQYVEILEKSNTNQLPANLQYYEIILNDRNSWLNLSDSYIEVRAKLTAADGVTALPSAAKIAPISDIQNLFRRAEAWVESKSVQTIEYPGVKSHILGLVKNSPDYAKSGSMELFYPDKIADIDGITGVLTATNNGVAAAITGTNASPHVIAVVGNVLDNPVNLYVGGQLLTPRLAATGVAIQLKKSSNADPGPLNYVGVVNGDIIYLYDPSGNRVYLQTTVGGVIGELRAAGGIVVFGDGDNTAVAAGDINGYTACRLESSMAQRIAKFTNAAGDFLTDSSTFYIPLRKIFSIYDYNRHVWKGATHRFRFDRDTVNEYMYRLNGVDARAVITFMSIWLPVVQPNALISAQLNAKLAEKAEKMMSWFDYEFYENNLITGAASVNEQIWRVTSKTERVVRVYMWLQRVDARSSQLVNKGVFGGFNIQSAQCSVNGVIYPRTKYDLDTTAVYKDSRLYNEYLRAGGHIANPSTGAYLSIEEWQDNYQIICFDLSYQPDAERVYTGRVSPSDIELRVQLAGAYGVDWRMYCLLQTERFAQLEAISDMMKIL